VDTGKLSVVSVKRIRWFVGVASFALIIWFVRDLLQPTHLIARYSEFKLIIQNQYLWSALIFFLIYLAVVSLSLPVASLLTLMGAALFGWISLPIIVSAATAGALVVFLLASTIAREFFSQRAGGAIDSVQTAFHRSPIRWLLTMRLIPFFPFWLVNIIPALLQMRMRDYVLATAVGIIPGTAVYVSVGRGLDTILDQGLKPQWNLIEHPEVWLPLVLLGAFSGVSALISNRYSDEVHS
jgi:uncharacterized membrane protein YdjX (TVP38/TMEM64 family)